MRHKAPRPLADSWRRLPPATARLLGQAAGERPFHALVAVVVTLSLGAGAYLALPPASGGSSAEPTVLAGSTPPGESEPLRPTDEASTSGGGPMSAISSNPGSSDPGGSDPGATGQPGTADPSTGVTSAPATRPGPGTDSSSTGTTTAAPTASSTPDTSGTPATPSPPSADASTTTEDVTPPDTRVVAEEFPEGDTAEFGLSATEPATFVCSLDEAAFTPCGSHVVLSDLDPGWHTLAVLATDAAGNADPSPAETSWVATMASPSDD